MEKIKAFQETNKRFLKLVDEIKEKDTLGDLSDHELAIRASLQLMEVQLANTAFDIREAVIARKREILSGENLHPAKKAVAEVKDAVKTAVKKATKAKKADK